MHPTLFLPFFFVYVSADAEIFQRCYIPQEIKGNFHAEAINSASSDFGNIVHILPSAIFFPSNVEDIRKLIRSSYNCSNPFLISARGNSHSTEGQATAENGVVIDMRELRKRRLAYGVSLADDLSYADVGGEMWWSDVLNQTFSKGVLPVSWTDYLKLTVGGTLSNAGISGQTFRFGPQISNVLEMDVITGKGELVKCSASENREAFLAVLGGFGQFGIITRARIRLQPAKQRALWFLLLYTNFTRFKTDQEAIIAGRRAVGYLEGQVFLQNSNPNGWEASFPVNYRAQIRTLLKQYGVLYCIEVVEPYFTLEAQAAKTKMKSILNMLNPIRELVHKVDVPYVDFLKRVPDNEDTTLSHPWHSLSVPRSGISEFDYGVIRNIVLKSNITMDLILMYPLLSSKWNRKTSAALPSEEVFYAVSFLNECERVNLEAYTNLNTAIMTFCETKGLQIKRYLHSYSSKQKWIEHFGPKWPMFFKRKVNFDPKNLLSSGQKIFNQ